jgi:hypothetical protein
MEMPERESLEFPPRETPLVLEVIHQSACEHLAVNHSPGILSDESDIILDGAFD